MILFCNMPLSQGVYRCYTSNWMQIVKCDFIEVLLKRFHKLPYAQLPCCSQSLQPTIPRAASVQKPQEQKSERLEVGWEWGGWFNPKLWLSHSENHDCITRILIMINPLEFDGIHHMQVILLNLPRFTCLPEPQARFECKMLLRLSGASLAQCNRYHYNRSNKLSSLPRLCQTLPPAKWLWRTTSNANIQKEWKRLEGSTLQQLVFMRAHHIDMLQHLPNHRGFAL